MVARALGQWRERGAAAADLGFWRGQLRDFHSPKSFALVVDALLRKEDLKAAMALLNTWLSQAAEGVAPGEGTSPAMTWANTPAGTQSFVLNMHDMDVVRNKTSDDQAHWVVWNIPATATGLPEGVPKGAQLADGSYQISATGQMYRGPGAPANGPPHHYMFEIYALDTKLDVQPISDAFETRGAKENGRPARARSWALRIFDAATISIALVICAVLPTE